MLEVEVHSPGSRVTVSPTVSVEQSPPHDRTGSVTAAGPAPAIVSPVGWFPAGMYCSLGSLPSMFAMPIELVSSLAQKMSLKVTTRSAGSYTCAMKSWLAAVPVEVGSANAAAVEIVAPVEVAGDRARALRASSRP